MKIANQSVVHALLFFVLVSYPSSIEAGKQGGGPKGVTAVKSLRRILQDEDSVVSQDEDNMSFASNSMDDDRSIQGPTKRECEFSQVSTKEVEFECKAKTEDETTDMEIKDEIKFEVSAEGSDGLKVKVEYENETETTLEETETETQFEIVFHRIIEYRKALSSVALSSSGQETTPDNQAFHWEQDTIVQEWSMEDWEDFTQVVDDGNLSTFSVSTPDAIATFTFTIARATESDVITANKMKIDFELNNFPWASEDTYVALICTVESQKTVEVEFEDGTDSQKTKDVKISFGDASNAIGFVPFGEYTWQETAEVMDAAKDTNSTTSPISETIAVIATSPTPNMNAEESSNEIAFSFVGGPAQTAANIYWDPEAGIGYEEATAVNANSGAKPIAVGTTTLVVTGLVSALSMWM